MATENDKPEQAAKIVPETVTEKDDSKGSPKPGFGKEGSRSELSDGAPLPPDVRKENEERNRE